MKKWWFLVGILIGIILFMALTPQNTKNRGFVENPYSEESKDWIINTGDNGKISEISIEKATENKGYYYKGASRYLENNEEYLISIFGFYNSESFNKEYSKDNKILFKIGTEMNPRDGIPEGFALLKKENNSFVIYLFVDEDWKRTSDNLNIIWSENLSDSSKMNSRKFNFDNYENGIYIEKISSDLSWLEKDFRNGGIVFGDISLDEFEKNDFNSIFIMIR